jgi:biotin operon repressor
VFFMKLRILIFSIFLCPVMLAAQGLDTAKIDEAMGRSGQTTGDVYRLGFPRTDLHVSIGGVDIKPGLALGSWAAFAGNDHDAMVMGDLVLLENELTPVMKKLRAAGFDISAVHNHVLSESPRVIYMHYMGHGKAVELAKFLHSALAESKTPLDKPTPPAPAAEPPAFVKTIEDIVGTKGRFAGGVLSFGIPRAAAITDHGMTLTTAQGVAEAINFQEAGTGKVATTGDFVLTAEEVNPVISALEEHGIEVTALHSHMLTEQPRLFFMHFWAVGPTESVAAGIKAALSHVAVK